MSVLWFDGLLAQHENAGVYFLPEGDIEELREAAAVNQFPCLRIDLGGCDNKAELLARFARALHFPDYFGHNWDALSDCLRDLRVADTRGLVLLLEGSQRLRREAPADFKTAMEVLQAVSSDWGERRSALWSFIAVSEAEFAAL